MLKKDVISHFGSVAKTAKALGYTPQAIYKWKRRVPSRAQYVIQVVTGGKLQVDRAA